MTGPCSRYDNQWPEDEDMEHIHPDDYPVFEEERDITPLDYEYVDDDTPFLEQEDTPEELNFNNDGWR